ncbi:MAG: hypothetical protein ACYCYO_01985 [Bacilli bacterium]
MAVDIQIEGASYIGGHNASGYWLVDLETVNVDQDIAIQQTSATFTVRIVGTYDEATGQWAWPIGRPKAGQEAVFLNAAGLREFGGILLNPVEKELAPNYMMYTCNCSDFSKWFDRHLVNNNYQAGITVQQLITDIVNEYVNTVGNTRTFTTNNVQSYPAIPLPLMQFIYLAPSEVMAQIVQMLGWGFYLDFYRDVNFFSTETFLSPLPNNTLNADDLWVNPTDTSVLPNWIDLSIGEDASQLKNQVYITGIYVAQQQLYSQSFTGDGKATVFTLGYEPPNDITNFVATVDGSVQQIALDLVGGTPGGPCAANTVYVNFTGQTIRFCTAPAAGATIAVTYYPMTQTVVMQNNPQAQAYQASVDGTDGIYEYNRMDPSLSAESPALAQTRAGMTLTKYAYPLISGTFTSFLQGWFVGQYFYFQSQRRMQGAYNGHKFFVTRITKKIIQANGEWTWQYTINFANIPFEF